MCSTGSLLFTGSRVAHASGGVKATPRLPGNSWHASPIHTAQLGQSRPRGINNGKERRRVNSITLSTRTPNVNKYVSPWICSGITIIMIEHIMRAVMRFSECIMARQPADIVQLGVTLVPEGRRLFLKLTVEENLLLGAFRADSRRDRDHAV